ncbi:MAG: hypothetical protein ACR2G6_09635 [Gemmatimonadaceae bacterium]
MTLSNAALRAVGFHTSHETITDAIAVALAILGGAGLRLVAWAPPPRDARVRHRSTCRDDAHGWPVPIANSARAFGILFAVHAASLMGGAVVGALELTVRRTLAQERPTFS